MRLSHCRRPAWGVSAFFLTALLVVGGASDALAQAIPAFPGADGAAAYVSGGRGGIVYHVTKLDSRIDGGSAIFEPGTLRYGLQNSNFPAGVPRTIVFDVGGVFSLGRRPRPEDNWDPNGNGWDSQSRLTIGGENVTFAGQTAPGTAGETPGVIFMGGGLKPQGNNNIIRNITVASGYGMRNWWDPGDPFPSQPGPGDVGGNNYPDSVVYDAMDISGTNLMIDHVSTLYATDETISMNEVADNITIQYSNISQAQNYPQWDAEGGGYTGHALGSLLEAGDNAAISFHHNLYAHLKSRVPQAQGDQGYYDFRNNVFYNWFGTAGRSSGDSRMNLIANFYLAGDGGDDPNGGNDPGIGSENGGTGVVNDSSVYKEANLRDINRDGDPNDGTLVTGSGASSPFWSGGQVTYAGVTENARDAFDTVTSYVGANWWTRDAVVDTPDERIIDETLNGTGKVVAWADDPWDNTDGAEWQKLVATPQSTRAAGWDTEAPNPGEEDWGVGDGMPTHWELLHGLNPNVRDNNGDFDNDGYTNLEEYLNEVAAWPAPEAIVFNNANGDSRYEHILNWDANPDTAQTHPWQPSRFDAAVIDSGVVTVDSVGQHAGTLILGSAPGDSPTLNITAGWIRVEDAGHGMSTGAVVIGDHATSAATLNLTGGFLSTETLLKGDSGAFNFTGGTLSAETIGFDLVNNGGAIAPGDPFDAPIGATLVDGDATLNTGVLAIELLSPTENDLLDVDGLLTLGGSLEVTLLDGFTPTSGSWVIATANSFDGGFASVTPGFVVSQQGGDLVLSLGPSQPGDFNGDNQVDALDYAVWREAYAAGQRPASDFDVWLNNFGFGLSPAPAAGDSAPVQTPEPATAVLALVLAVAAARGRRRC